MTRAMFMLLALAIYLIFFATFLYLIGFVAALPLLPRTVDHGPAAARDVALAIDCGLIALFGLQHSIMARGWFKRAWIRIAPEPLERGLYVLGSSIVLIALFAGWRPIDGTVWHVSADPARLLLWGLSGAGWLIVLLSTFLLNHFELFGLSQTFRHLRGHGGAAPVFRIPLFYRLVRHPLYSGFVIAFWATPTMSWGHLLLALGMTAYILIALRYEERDLVATFGPEYEDYRRRVGMLAPRLRRSPG